MWCLLLGFGAILTLSCQNFLLCEGKNSQASLDPSFRIYRGHKAKEGQFPEMVSLRSLVEVHNPHFCGGVILAKNWVITAAHCVDIFSTWYALPYHLRNQSYPLVMMAGDIYQVPLKDAKQLRFATKIHIHPDWTNSTLTFPALHDVALLEVDDPFVFDDVHVKPIKYIDKEVNYLDRCLVAGWGETATHTISYDLLSTEVKYIPKSECFKLLNLSYVNSSRGLECAGDLKGETGPCFRDAGSGLVCSGKLAGVTNQVFMGCALSKYHGLASVMDILYYAPWISTFIAELKSYPTTPRTPTETIEIDEDPSLFNHTLFGLPQPRCGCESSLRSKDTQMLLLVSFCVLIFHQISDKLDFLFSWII